MDKLIVVFVFIFVLLGMPPSPAQTAGHHSNIRRSFDDGKSLELKPASPESQTAIDDFRAKAGMFSTVRRVNPAKTRNFHDLRIDHNEFLNPVQQEVEFATTRFFKLFEKFDKQPIAVKGKFPLVIDKFKFFGEPILCRVDCLNDEESNYYLVLMHFNIPALNPAFGPIRYSFARFEAKFVLYSGDPVEAGQTKFANNARMFELRATELKPVKVIAIFPQNEVLGIDRTDSNKVTVEGKPEFSGMAAGSVAEEWSNSENYHVGLPTIISTATKYGDAAWTFYPAKAQPLILGSRTTMALLQLPKAIAKSKLKLRIQSALDYQLKLLNIIPTFEQKLLAAGTCDPASAPSLEEVLTIHSLDVPPNMVALIQNTFCKNVQHNLELKEAKVSGGKDYVIDNSQKLYRVDEEGLTELKFNNDATNRHNQQK